MIFYTYKYTKAKAKKISLVANKVSKLTRNQAIEFHFGFDPYFLFTGDISQYDMLIQQLRNNAWSRRAQK